MVSNLVLCGLLGRIDQRRHYNQAKKKETKKLNVRLREEDRYVESSGTPVVGGWSSTMIDVLSVMFGYCFKLEEQNVLVA